MRLQKGFGLLSVVFLLLLVTPDAAAEGIAPRRADAFAMGGTQYAQLIIERRIIIRVPTLVTRRSGPLPQAEIEWKEKKANRCVPMKAIVGAAITRDDSVDLILSDQRRVRARLNDECRSVDFYSGFYMEPTKDDRLCADRDMIHARNGAMCEIEKFRKLVAEE